MDYLRELEIVDAVNKKLIDSSYSMQQFYLAKDFEKLNKITLGQKFPKQFLNHYFFSFLSLDRQNHLIFNLRKLFS